MRIRIAGALALLAVAAPVSAQQAAPAPPAFAPANMTQAGIRSLAANCAACHGTNGRAAPGSTVPGLAGRYAADIIQAMKDFREGKRSPTVMHQIAKGYSEDETVAIAEFFARQQQ